MRLSPRRPRSISAAASTRLRKAGASEPTSGWPRRSGVALAMLPALNSSEVRWITGPCTSKPYSSIGTSSTKARINSCRLRRRRLSLSCRCRCRSIEACKKASIAPGPSALLSSAARCAWLGAACRRRNHAARSSPLASVTSTAASLARRRSPASSSSSSVPCLRFQSSHLRSSSTNAAKRSASWSMAWRSRGQPRISDSCETFSVMRCGSSSSQYR